MVSEVFPTPISTLIHTILSTFQSKITHKPQNKLENTFRELIAGTTSWSQIKYQTCWNFLILTPTITKVFLCLNLIHKTSGMPELGGVSHAIYRSDTLEKDSSLSEFNAEIRMWSCREFMALTPTITKVFLCLNLIHKLSETSVHGGVFHVNYRSDRTRICSKKLENPLQNPSMWNDLRSVLRRASNRKE